MDLKLVHRRFPLSGALTLFIIWDCCGNSRTLSVCVLKQTTHSCQSLSGLCNLATTLWCNRQKG